jgi:hypothetical protein
MSRKWILGTIMVVAVGLTATAASAVFGGGSTGRPDYASVEVRMDGVAPGSSNFRAKKAKKPSVIYLQGDVSTVDVSATGPYIDVGLASCPGKSKVIDGGVAPQSTGVYQQGSYIPSDKEYHVLIGFETGETPADFQLTSHLVCIKGVK